MNNQFDDFDAETLEEFANGELFSRAVTRSAKKAANITKLKRKAEELVREAKKPKTVIKEEYIKDEPVNNEPADVAENALPGKLPTIMLEHVINTYCRNAVSKALRKQFIEQRGLSS